jgi:hypothetical protein
MSHDITWLTSFSQPYYDSVAQYNLPGWSLLDGPKVIMAENMPGFAYPGIDVIDAAPAYPGKDDPHWQISGKKHKFWKKGKCFLWAIRNFKTRYVIWLDSDVRVNAKPDLSRFMPEEGQVASIICGDLKQAESGFVIIDTQHPLFESWTKVYEEAWYNGVVDTLHKPWDNDVLWYAVKNLPHRNLSKSVRRSPQGFEDTDLLDYFYHYSGKAQKHLIREQA